MTAYLVYEVLQPDVSLSSLYYGGQSTAIPRCKMSALLNLPRVLIIMWFIITLILSASNIVMNGRILSGRINLFKR